MVRVAASPEFMLNGVAVSPRGRVFASFPRWTALDAPQSAVAPVLRITLPQRSTSERIRLASPAPEEPIGWK